MCEEAKRCVWTAISRSSAEAFPPTRRRFQQWGLLTALFYSFESPGFLTSLPYRMLALNLMPRCVLRPICSLCASEPHRRVARCRLAAWAGTGMWGNRAQRVQIWRDFSPICKQKEAPTSAEALEWPFCRYPGESRSSAGRSRSKLSSSNIRDHEWTRWLNLLHISNLSAKTRAPGALRPAPPALLCTFLSASSLRCRLQMTFVIKAAVVIKNWAFPN